MGIENFNNYHKCSPFVSSLRMNSLHLDYLVMVFLIEKVMYEIYDLYHRDKRKTRQQNS